MNKYVIYILKFPDGRYYIGKAKDFRRRMNQHKNGISNDKNLKCALIKSCRRFVGEVLFTAPQHMSDVAKQAWMDNMERIVIHSECQKVYNELTGEHSNYADYTFARNLINRKLVNTQLY